MLLYRCFLPSRGGGRVCGERVELRSGERVVSSGLCPLSQFFLIFQQSRERLRLCLSSLREARSADRKGLLKGGIMKFIWLKFFLWLYLHVCSFGTTGY